MEIIFFGDFLLWKWKLWSLQYPVFDCSPLPPFFLARETCTSLLHHIFITTYGAIRLCAALWWTWSSRLYFVAIFTCVSHDSCLTAFTIPHPLIVFWHSSPKPHTKHFSWPCRKRYESTLNCSPWPILLVIHVPPASPLLQCIIFLFGLHLFFLARPRHSVARTTQPRSSHWWDQKSSNSPLTDWSRSSKM